MKNGMRFVALVLLVFGFSVALSAQESQRPAKAKMSDEERLEKRMDRMNKTADELNMTDAQREQFIAAQLEFKEKSKRFRKSAAEKEAEREQMKALAAEHKTHLATFLSPEQMSAIEKQQLKKKHKRKSRKGHRMGIDNQPRQ